MDELMSTGAKYRYQITPQHLGARFRQPVHGYFFGNYPWATAHLPRIHFGSERDDSWNPGRFRRSNRPDSEGRIGTVQRLAREAKTLGAVGLRHGDAQ